MAVKSWRAKAKQRWGKNAAWINGDGQFAVVAPCRDLTVTLHPTREAAETAKTRIDKGGCGGQCTKMHQLVDLADPA